MAEVESGDLRMRYSGEVTVSVVLTVTDQYRCTVVDDNQDEYKMVVNPPAVLTDAIDSEEAFDRAAGAAISFVVAEAEERGENVCETLAYDHEGERWVSSDPECRWPHTEDN